jgi:hypothetical protein
MGKVPRLSLGTDLQVCKTDAAMIALRRGNIEM